MPNRVLFAKCGWLLVTLWLIITMTFIMMRVMPGDPFSSEQALHPEIRAQLRQHHGLDDPWLIQYGRYLQQAVTFDFGPSFRYKNRTVNEIILGGIGTSVLLGLEALTLAIAGGVSFGALGAFWRGKTPDTLLMAGSTLALSLPSFILATFLQYLLGSKLGLLPIARWDSFSHSILPAIALALMPMAFIARLTRSNLADVLSQNYIRTARSKGLPMSRVLIRHGLPNALLPLLPYFAQLSANVLTGSFVIERIFAVPGLGHAFVTSVQNRDYSTIMGVTVVYGALLLVLLFVADLFIYWMDPRLNKESITE